MNFSGEKRGDILIVTYFKTIATVAEAVEFKNFVMENIEEGTRKIIIDLEQIEMMDSTFLGALVVIHRKLLSLNNKLYLCKIQEPIKLLIGLTKLTNSFAIYSSVDEAVDEFSQ